MYVYRIVDTAEPKTSLAYSTTLENALALAKEAAEHYASLEFGGEIEIHRIQTDNLYYGGIFAEDTLVESVRFAAIPFEDGDKQ